MNSLSTFALLLFCTSNITHAQLECKCSRRTCKHVTSCASGLVWDACGCCQVCAKTEGELCGGVGHSEGICAPDMQCMVRNVRDNRNRMKQKIAQLVGKCEHVLCQRVQCPLAQTCWLVSGRTICTCPKCMSEMVTSPVCGEKDGRTYRNECELRRRECLKRKYIGIAASPCADKAMSRITCNDHSMRIELKKSSLKEKTEDQMISLMNSSCHLYENNTHYFRTHALQDCGTKVTYTLTSVMYSNVIRIVRHPFSPIVRHRDIQIAYECDYLLWSRNRNNKHTPILRLGRASVALRIVGRRNGVGIRIVSRRRTRKETLNDVDSQLRVDINPAETYVVELRPKWAVGRDVQLSPTSCYASPVSKSDRWMKYKLLSRGCPTEEGVRILDSRSSTIRLSVPNVRFLGSKRLGYIVRCKFRTCVKRTHVNQCLNIHKCTGRHRRRRSINDEDVRQAKQAVLFGRPIRLTP